MKTRVVAASIVVAIAVTVAVSVTVWLHSRTRNAPRYITAIYAVLPNGDEIEYGWLKTWVDTPLRSGYLNYWSFLRWRHDRSVRTHLVFFSYEQPVSEDIEMRATTDYRGVWLVDVGGPEEKGVVATLDLASGKFMDVNGESPNVNLPLQQQAGTGPRTMLPYPKWADVHTGKIIGRWRRCPE
jgi:hypothetical protein